MRQFIALLFSLLLFWTQAIGGAFAVTGAPPAKCRCCSCGTGGCCVGKAPSPDSAPQPSVPVPTVQLGQPLFTLCASPGWRLPRAEAEPVFAASSLPLPAAGVPLFQRDCALLI